MNVQALAVDKQVALEALKEYRAHRAKWDKMDAEIARIYRAISRGNAVISVHDAIRAGGIDPQGRPHLAIMRADQQFVRCTAWRSEGIEFNDEGGHRSGDLRFEIQWPDRAVRDNAWGLRAALPRIPPQHRPAAGELSKYHLLWEADWTDIPRDPYLLKRIGKDAWLVCAGWELSEVELSVLRARPS